MHFDFLTALSVRRIHLQKVDAMRDFLSRLFPSKGHNDVAPLPIPASSSPGQVYSFKTQPYSEFAPRETGRFAAFKVLGVNEQVVVIEILDGIWSNAPTLKEARKAAALRENRLSHSGRISNFGVLHEWWQLENDLNQVAFLGLVNLSMAEKERARATLQHEVGSRTAGLRFANYAAEGEFRWQHDREAFEAEAVLARAKAESQRVAKEERYRNRLSMLTWEQLKGEVHFGNWSPSPPFPPADFTEAARKVIFETCVSLEMLGPKPRKAAVRAILKKTVEWFNHADEDAGHVIETDEREDICAVLEEIAFVARQKALVDEIDEWRNW